VPANLPPQHLKAEDDARKAENAAPRLQNLPDLFRPSCNHKGTEKLHSNPIQLVDLQAASDEHVPLPPRTRGGLESSRIATYHLLGLVRIDPQTTNRLSDRARPLLADRSRAGSFDPGEKSHFERLLEAAGIRRSHVSGGQPAKHDQVLPDSGRFGLRFFPPGGSPAEGAFSV
jgi:hypothetical protein